MEESLSTQEASNKWIVFVGKKDYVLTQKQYELVLEATQRDVKMLHFGDFSISLSYISSMEKMKKPIETWTDTLPKENELMRVI